MGKASEITPLDNYDSASPFHRGEQTFQAMTGVRDKMERFGRQVIRDFMPDQHREFYQQLPYVFVGHADDQGWPWASILFGQPGFIQSPQPTSLTIDARSLEGDPLTESLANSEAPIDLGLLGIELTTRRRNRLSASVELGTDQRLNVSVRQAFGNCPQYIQTRDLEWLDDSTPNSAEVLPFEKSLDQAAVDLITRSDTFFVASYASKGEVTNEQNKGVDVSHRGGKPGFTKVDNGTTLTIPDYLGNFHFNTLGNLLENPKAGLLFIDFDSGDILTLTGRTEILWDSPETEYFEGAERLWRFRVESGRWLKNALPFRFTFGAFSQNSLLTGSWPEAKKLAQSERERNQFQPYVIQEIKEESSVIKSFYLEPRSSDFIPARFKAGQFITLRMPVTQEDQGSTVVRTYTASSAPSDGFLRISVKKEPAASDDLPEGLVSNRLHSDFSVGDVVEIKSPSGVFTFDPSETRPAVLIAGGIGITPMISMAREALAYGIKTRSMRAITMISAAKNAEQRAFFNEISALVQSSDGHVKSYWSLSNPEPGLKPGRDFHHHGRISKELLQAVLPIDDYDFYLCGPVGFMQSVYDLLLTLGVQDNNIHAESFGPSSLHRRPELTKDQPLQAEIADEAVVVFSKSGVEQSWTKEDGPILDFAESHGLTPEFGCRTGQCGSCKAVVKAGHLVHTQEPGVELNANEALLCCAVPSELDDKPMPEVVIEI
ncbi:pyridoxamine 5'-phosphate oxidase family protein [Litoribacillus peritrichatus]|uniref:Uncharacterized protein n=1 Tax=Litoribacillus peritrichatus TaxID=718191 RepID=A0ABP7N563_9GAMM